MQWVAQDQKGLKVGERGTKTGAAGSKDELFPEELASQAGLLANIRRLELLCPGRSSSEFAAIGPKPLAASTSKIIMRRS
tara:strand:+ start:778 stop:1017 length:240 start_codon:yes stop_codon:yes gene_type:complete